MILKGSQRGNGADLAIHLMNGFDNERIEIAEVYGTIAGDLYGAFAEFEAVAAGLLFCFIRIHCDNSTIVWLLAPGFRWPPWPGFLLRPAFHRSPYVYIIYLHHGCVNTYL